MMVHISKIWGVSWAPNLQDLLSSTSFWLVLLHWHHSLALCGGETDGSSFTSSPTPSTGKSTHHFIGSCWVTYLALNQSPWMGNVILIGLSQCLWDSHLLKKQEDKELRKGSAQRIIGSTEDEWFCAGWQNADTHHKDLSQYLARVWAGSRDPLPYSVLGSLIWHACLYIFTAYSCLWSQGAISTDIIYSWDFGGSTGAGN